MAGWVPLLVSCVVSLCFPAWGFAQEVFTPCWGNDPQQQRWVDSVLKALSLEERVAQSFMVTAYSKSSTPDAAVMRQVAKLHVGGLIFFQGTAPVQADLTNKYQAKARVPLLVGIDGEWGLGMRLSDAIAYPKAMALAATRMPQFAYRMGQHLGEQMRRLGVHMNFAPVADVNSNPNNPVIGVRSYGDSAELVAEMATAYALGMQQAGIIACAKHFPGHGGVNIDSHKSLPTITEPLSQLRERDWIPFRHMVRGGIGAVMTGHLAMRLEGDSASHVATFSSRVIDSMLRGELGFCGLVCSDALNMGAVTQGRKEVEACLEAYRAGCDILLCPQEVSGAISAIVKAVRHGQIDTAVVNARCRRILSAKYWAIGPSFKPIEAAGIEEQLHANEHEALVRTIAAESLTLVKDGRVPIGPVDGERLALVSYLDEKDEGFASTMRRYAPYTRRAEAVAKSDTSAVAAALGDATLVVIAAKATGYSPRERYGLKLEQIEFIKSCARIRPTVLVLFGSPYALTSLGALSDFEGVLLAYDAEPATREAAAQALFGGKPVRGMLPVDLDSALRRGTGVQKEGGLRLGYVMPEEIGANRTLIAMADSLAQWAIDSGAMPGMQIVAASRGQVFYRRFLGRYTYAQDSPQVADSTIYDLASLSKIVATTPLVMREYEKKKSYSLSVSRTTSPSLIRRR